MVTVPPIATTTIRITRGQPPIWNQKCPNVDYGQETVGGELALNPRPYSAAERRQSVAPGEPGVGVVVERSPGGAKDCENSFAPPGLRSFRKKTPGSHPGLHSVAAPRLAMAA